MTITATEAYEAMRAHHKALSEELAGRADAVSGAAAAGLPHGAPVAAFIAYLAEEVLTHAAAEERAIYPVAAAGVGLAGAVGEMIAEHVTLSALGARLAALTGGAAAGELAQQVAGLFAAHAARENDMLLPALLADQSVDLAALLDRMHHDGGAGTPAPAGEDQGADPKAEVLFLLLRAAAALARAGEADRACRIAASAWAALHEARPDLAGRVTACSCWLTTTTPGRCATSSRPSTRASSPGITWRPGRGCGGCGSAAPSPSRKGNAMHGEFKPPGEKLVAADVEVAGGELGRVQVSGDFFPGPDGALGRLNAALTGIPAVEDVPAMTARITAALGGDAELAGFTAGAVAAAVRRALTRASGWRDHDWRLVRDEPQDPALHMALDEVLAREVEAGRRPPTLRIWEWSAPAVVIGSFQSLRNEVDTAEASRLGFTVVRRVSGGGAMFVEPASTITYSLYAPESLVAGMSYAESYRFLDDWVIGALTEDLGIAAWYQPLNDITSAQGKIGGAAQKRLAGGTVLHHVTMAYDIDAGAMTRVLRIGREKLSDKGIVSAAKRVDPLRRQTRLPRAEIIDALVGHFRRRYGLTPDTVTGGELRAARDLAQTKFASSQWTARVP